MGTWGNWKVADADPNKRVKLTRFPLVNDEKLNAIEDHNVARRATVRILPDLQEVLLRRKLTSVPMFRQREADDFIPVPDRVEVVPKEGFEHINPVDALNGGFSRPLQNFYCETCGYASSRFSMFAIISYIT